MVGVRVQSASSVTTRYFQTDNLGSLAVITDESGNVVERDSYDAWGKRRFPNGADDPSGSLSSQTTRGFTGQEQLTDVGLVHLNGRVYDPLVGRMMSADPFVPDPMNGQAWNPYSYVINNPLALTDTNGYCFLGLCSLGHAISTFFNRTFGVLFRKFPILGNLFEIAAVALCFGNPVCVVGVSFASTTFVAGVTLGVALQAGIIAAITAGAFQVGGGTGGGIASPTEDDLANAYAYADDAGAAGGGTRLPTIYITAPKDGPIVVPGGTGTDGVGCDYCITTGGTAGGSGTGGGSAAGTLAGGIVAGSIQLAMEDPKEKFRNMFGGRGRGGEGGGGARAAIEVAPRVLTADDIGVDRGALQELRGNIRSKMELLLLRLT
jgi:RHS repeat-associated protein